MGKLHLLTSRGTRPNLTNHVAFVSLTDQSDSCFVSFSQSDVFSIDQSAGGGGVFLSSRPAKLFFCVF